MATLTRLLRGAAKIAGLTALAIMLGSPANAGQWVNGGAFDPERGVGVNFLRFLAGEGEGQMTIRCDSRDGLWLDVGVLGNGELPPGTVAGDLIDATLAFRNGDEVTTIVARGSLVIRGDGAVVVSLAGEAAFEAGQLLLEPAEELDITIAGITRTLPMDEIAERSAALADWCGAWPLSAASSVAGG